MGIGVYITIESQATRHKLVMTVVPEALRLLRFLMVTSSSARDLGMTSPDEMARRLAVLLREEGEKLERVAGVVVLSVTASFVGKLTAAMKGMQRCLATRETRRYQVVTAGTEGNKNAAEKV
jgi:hypothetical protein